MASKKLKVDLIGDATDVIEAFDETEKAGSKFGDKMGKIGDKLAKGLAVGATAAIAVGTKGIMDAFKNAATVDNLKLDLGVSKEYAEKLGKASGAAYAAGFGESQADAVEAVKAVNTAFSDYVDDADLQPLTEQALALTETFGVDMTEAMGAAHTMLSNGLVKDGGEAMDTLASGLKGLSPAVRDEVLAATNEYSKHFAALGVSGQEAMRLFSQADGVIGVDKLGDALKELTIRSSDMSATSVAAYDAMGLNAEQMSNKMLAGGDTARGAMDEIVNGLLSIKDPTKQANTAIALFGTPLEDLGTDQVPTFLNSLANMDTGLQDVKGSAADMAKTLEKQPQRKLEAFKRKALSKVATFMADKAIPAFEKLGKKAKELGERLAPTFKPIVDFVKKNPAPVLAALAVVIGVPLVAAFVAWAASALSAAAATFIALAPIMLVIAAIALLVTGFVLAYQKVGWFRDAVDAVGRFFRDTLWPILQSVGAWIRDTLVPIIGKIATKFKDIAVSIGTNVGEIVGFVIGIPGRIASTVSTLWDGIKTGISEAKNWVGDAVGKLVGFVTGIPGKISDAASGMFDGIKEAFRSAINFIIRGWNGMEFKIPGFKVGPVGYDGFTLGLPDIPELHTGGVVPGGRFDEPLYRLQGGETVLPRGASMVPASGGPTQVINVSITVEGTVVSERNLVQAVVDGVNKMQSRQSRPLMPGAA